MRRINSQIRWDDIRKNIEESNCNIICFQETKKEIFDLSYIRKFCPRRFNQFAYSPSVGSSGGIITIWNGNLFNGTEISSSKFHVTVELICKISGQLWYLTNVYGPTSSADRALFINWLVSIDTSPMHLWMILGDFNLIREPDNRNRPGGDVHNMLEFNRFIRHHDLLEIPLKGRAYTWSNMQNDPLLEKLDWVFTSSSWTGFFPNTIATPLAKLSSDHVPIKIQIGLSIPMAKVFRFEEFWLNMQGFSETVSTFWQHHGVYKNAAQDITARLKSLRYGLKRWSKSLSQLNKTIDSCNFVLALLDGLEDQRLLSLLEKTLEYL